MAGPIRYNVAFLEDPRQSMHSYLPTFNISSLIIGSSSLDGLLFKAACASSIAPLQDDSGRWIVRYLFVQLRGKG